MPFAKVEVAAVPVRSKLVVLIPPTKVEVPVPAAINRSADNVEEAVKAPATCKVLATVEEAWAMKPPATVKANTEVEEKSWISKTFLVCPCKVRKAKLMEPVEVAPTVTTALALTEEVPITTLSVMVCCPTMVPVSVKPETLEAEIAPHKILPVESVVRAEEPEQPVANNWILPPVN